MRSERPRNVSGHGRNVRSSLRPLRSDERDECPGSMEKEGTRKINPLPTSLQSNPQSPGISTLILIACRQELRTHLSLEKRYVEAGPETLVLQEEQIGT